MRAMLRVAPKIKTGIRPTSDSIMPQKNEQTALVTPYTIITKPIQPELLRIFNRIRNSYNNLDGYESIEQILNEKLRSFH